MVYYVPIRKLFKLLFSRRPGTKRDRTPTSLSDCLINETHHTQHWRMFSVVILLIVVFLNIQLISSNSKNLRRLLTMKLISREDPILNLLNGITNDSFMEHNTTVICRVNQDEFGNVTVNKTVTEVALGEYPWVNDGGYFFPIDCKSRHKVAIMVPFRNRQANLAVFLYNIHPFLKKQKIAYRIFVIEQFGEDRFNRGKIFNAGYKEVKRFGPWRCVIFHDVDLLPLNENIMYTCPTWPRHMCAVVDSVANSSFRSLFGGVAAMSVQHFEMVNGYSNEYWGWGAEDHDLFWRIRLLGLPVVRYSKTIARYTSLQHINQTRNDLRFRLLRSMKVRHRRDGLNSLTYKVISASNQHLYTHIIVNINQPIKV